MNMCVLYSLETKNVEDMQFMNKYSYIYEREIELGRVSTTYSYMRSRLMENTYCE